MNLRLAFSSWVTPSRMPSRPYTEADEPSALAFVAASRPFTDNPRFSPDLAPDLAADLDIAASRRHASMLAPQSRRASLSGHRRLAQRSHGSRNPGASAVEDVSGQGLGASAGLDSLASIVVPPWAQPDALPGSSGAGARSGAGADALGPLEMALNEARAALGASPHIDEGRLRRRRREGRIQASERLHTRRGSRRETSGRSGVGERGAENGNGGSGRQQGQARLEGSCDERRARRRERRHRRAEREEAASGSGDSPVQRAAGDNSSLDQRRAERNHRRGERRGERRLERRNERAQRRSERAQRRSERTQRRVERSQRRAQRTNSSARPVHTPANTPFTFTSEYDDTEETPPYRETFHKYLDLLSFDPRFSPVLRVNKSLIRSSSQLRQSIEMFEDFNLFPRDIDPYRLDHVDDRYFEDLIPELIPEDARDDTFSITDEALQLAYQISLLETSGDGADRTSVNTIFYEAHERYEEADTGAAMLEQDTPLAGNSPSVSSALGASTPLGRATPRPGQRRPQDAQTSPAARTYSPRIQLPSSERFGAP